MDAWHRNGPDSETAPTEMPSVFTQPPRPASEAGLPNYAAVASDGVWPPRPDSSSAVTAPLPFTFIYRKLLGNLADVRTGTFQVDPQYFTIEGKAMVRREIYVPILICAILLRFGWLIAYLLLRYAFLQNALIRIPWSDVTQIVVTPEKRWVGIAYNAPNYKGKILPFTLAGQLKPGDYDSFVSAASQLAGGKFSVGKLPGTTTKTTWILLGVLAALLVAVLIIVGLSTGPHR